MSAYLPAAILPAMMVMGPPSETANLNEMLPFISHLGDGVLSQQKKRSLKTIPCLYLLNFVSFFIFHFYACQVQFVLPIYYWMCGLPLERG